MDAKAATKTKNVKIILLDFSLEFNRSYTFFNKLKNPITF